jgi:uncharacterized protein
MRCPICKKQVPDADDQRPKTYPFCTERCKLIDLGRWLGGHYQIPAEDEEGQAMPPPPSPDRKEE